MKKIFAFLLLGLTVAFASCGDEKTETGTDWFLTPVAEVNGTTVGQGRSSKLGRTTCPTPIPNGPLSELLRRRA